MTVNALQTGLQEASSGFDYIGVLTGTLPFGNGHINDTYILTFSDGERERKYTLQHMNKHVFPHPDKLMESLMGISAFLKEKITAAGGDPHRETLDFVYARSGKPYFIDSFGEYWRSYRFIDHAYSLDTVESPEDFYQSALAFGHFQYLLCDYPVETLYEVIPGFHDTAARFGVFQKVVEENKFKRAASAQKEIQFYLEHKDVAFILGNLLKQGTLPLRVTHNDTKSNNVLIDEETHTGLCVIDLDTVMPGLSVNDFGDSIRFGASTASEDEKDLSKVSCDLTLYEAYLKGFIEGCKDQLTDAEIINLPVGAKVMTYECGMRFLTDYLQNDIYFKTEYPEHNLDRARTQMTLVADMEQKWSEIMAITARYL